MRQPAPWVMALREFLASKGEGSLLNAVRESKDPAMFTVLFEDSAALLGLAIAMAGIALGQYLDMPIFDGIASILIGVILALTAVFLAYECKSLLIGEAAAPKVEASIRNLLKDEPTIQSVNEMLTMHFGPQDLLVTLSLDFKSDYSSDDVEDAVARIEEMIKSTHPEVKRIFIEAQSWSAHIKAKQAG